MRSFVKSKWNHNQWNKHKAQYSNYIHNAWTQQNQHDDFHCIIFFTQLHPFTYVNTYWTARVWVIYFCRKHEFCMKWPGLQNVFKTSHTIIEHWIKILAWSSQTHFPDCSSLLNISFSVCTIKISLYQLKPLKISM